MDLTATWCHQIVLQQDKGKIDEPFNRKEWTSQRGKSLKGRTGRGNRGKVEEEKQTDKNHQRDISISQKAPWQS